MPVQFTLNAFTNLPPLLGMTLSQLTLVHRHGERTPISPVKYSFTPDNWSICFLTPTIQNSYLLSNPSQVIKPSLLVPNLEHILTNPSINGILTPQTLTHLTHKHPPCFQGQLTDPGKRNMFQLGKNLLAHYPFITTLTTKDIYVRSTDYARTLESVHYLVSGLDIDITIHVKSEETMFPDEKCKSLQVMVKAFKDIPKAGNDALMNGHSQYDAAACVRDNFGVVVKDIEVMEDMCVKRWWDMYKRQDLSRLASCRFIGEIKEFILTDKPLGIFSGHDSTLAPMLGAFGVFDGRFPPFGSIVGFEVWKNEQKEKFVRMHYNGKKIFLPACGAIGKHLEGDESVCTFDAFMDCVDAVIPSDYETECNTVQ